MTRTHRTGFAMRLRCGVVTSDFPSPLFLLFLFFFGVRYLSGFKIPEWNVVDLRAVDIDLGIASKWIV